MRRRELVTTDVVLKKEKFRGEELGLWINGERTVPVCLRYPTLKMCGCTIPCRTAYSEVTLDPILSPNDTADDFQLYVGPYQSALKTRELLEKDVRFIIDVSATPYEKSENLFTYWSKDVDDTPNADISMLFDSVHGFIDQARQVCRNSNLPCGVLVHCHAGVSRSATLCCSYLMHARLASTLDVALGKVQRARSRCQPNSGFLCQLREFETHLTS